jgi:adenosine deaminase
MNDIAAFIRGLPKVELHVHIEGTLEPELRFALAERNGTRLAYADVAALRASYRFNDLTSFLVSYYEGIEVLVTADDFHDLAWAYLRRAHDERAPGRRATRSRCTATSTRSTRSSTFASVSRSSGWTGSTTG